LVIFVFIIGLGSFSFAPTVQAQLITSDVNLVTNKIEMSIDQVIKVAVLNSALQAMSYFTRKFAYDSAVWLSSGGKGQNPFVHTKNFGDYLTNVADNAVGTAIEALGTPFGLNLCHIPDARLDLTLRVGLGFVYGINVPGSGGEFPPKPACTFSDFRKEWTMEKWNSKYGAGNIEDRFNASFKTDDSDLGIYLDAVAKIDRLQAKAVAGAEKQRQEDQGAVGFTDLIAGNIKTPGAVMMEEIKAQAPSKGKEASDQQINSAFSAGVYQILPSTLSVFLNTLAGTMLSNYQNKGMFPFGIGYDEGGSNATDYYADGSGGFIGGRKQAQEVFMEYMVAKIRPSDNYTIMARFSACPDNPAPDNCVADQELVIAVQEAAYGKPITIQEALDRGILTGARKLIPPSRKAENMDKNCYENNYCYRNVQMLRKARVLPLGFEIAAFWTSNKRLTCY